MSGNIVEEIKNKLTINTVMWYYLLWDKRIKWNHKYQCPFHWDWNEKTPSMYASDDRGNFKCFWCQKYWDIIARLKSSFISISNIFFILLAYNWFFCLSKFYNYKGN